MLRPFFYNARTRGPTLARDIIFLVKPDPTRITARIAGRALLSMKGGRPRLPTVRGAWSNWCCGPFDLALPPLRCAPLRLTAMTYGGPLACQLYQFVVANEIWFDVASNYSHMNSLRFVLKLSIKGQ